MESSCFSHLASRREFLAGISALMVPGLARSQAAGVRGAFGIAYTSFSIRMRQARQSQAEGEGPAIPADKFIDLCKSFGGDGCQMEISQLEVADADYLDKIRKAAEDKAMFLELSVGAAVLQDADALGRVAAIAQGLGVKRIRMAVNGRRYEEFFDFQKWKEFHDHWQRVFEQAEPQLKQHGLYAGIENHKEWMADELATILTKISSPHLGACVDFGNNLALLEDSIAVAEKLGPFAVTSHLKDMAVMEHEEGFLLSEVPLGQGILPLAKIMEILRRSRPDIRFCLEMITRDPLKVPCLTDQYWASHEKRDAQRIEAFKKSILSHSLTQPLPKISTMSSQRMLAVEDDNIRRSVAYSKRTLGL
ncbi:MAG: TIM barrel protein [Acidobacteriota bacterium]